jgi:hypothetical protein
MSIPRDTGRPTKTMTAAAIAGATLTTMALLATGATVRAAPAHPDQVAYLVNVTVRPGYNFANADNALAYRQGTCEKSASATPYRLIMREVKAEFAITDECQASYLVAQAANEHCQPQIWPLRNSAAAGYRPPPL